MLANTRKSSIFLRIMNWFFGCRHDSMSRVFTLKSRSYRVCYDCGHEFNYSLTQMKIAAEPIPARILGGAEVLTMQSRQLATVESRASKLGRARA